MHKDIRLRFAPSPTGMMHLGNIRAALMNALFARHKKGLFILRIEDTDAVRNFDMGAKKIIEDLEWLGLDYDEGPGKEGDCAPYFQSERTNLYKKHLDSLIAQQLVYRCFCSPEELEKKRLRQIACKKPPRYDRACLTLDQEQIAQKLKENILFIWRYHLNQEEHVTINDLAHGAIVFELKNFSDFPLTRSDGSFTFIFANFVDDMLMRITHVIRGEDHLSNTACQAVLFKAFKVALPIFWHLPMLCNIEGKKLSKRDFGFSLRDLQAGGFLPEAIVNYVAIIGGGSFKEEIMSFDELAQTIAFDHLHSTGQVKFDPEKLKWINNKWIARLMPDQLLHYCLPLIEATYPQVKKVLQPKISSILQLLKTDLMTINDIVDVVRFYFESPTLQLTHFAHFTDKQKLQEAVTALLAHCNDVDLFIQQAKQLVKEKNIKMKELFEFIRLGLMGSVQGPSIHDLITILGAEETKKRLSTLVNF